MKLLSLAPNLNRLCFHLRVEDTSPLDPTPAPVGNRTPAPGGGSSAEGINMPSAMEALQADIQGLLIGGDRPLLKVKVRSPRQVQAR